MIYRKIAKKSRYRKKTPAKKRKGWAGKIITKLKSRFKKINRLGKSFFKKIHTKKKRRHGKSTAIRSAPFKKIIASIKAGLNRIIESVQNKARSIKNRSRASWRDFRPDIKKTDLFLAISLTVMSIGFLIMNLAVKKPSQPKRIELRLSQQWETIFNQESLDELIAEFEKLNPQFKIKYPGQEKNSGQDVFDIVFMDDSLLSSFIRQDALLPLNKWIQEPANNAGQWAIPLVMSMDLLFYNIDLLSTVEVDRPPKTRDEFLKYVRAVQAGSNKISGTALGLSQEDPHAVRREFFSWFWAAGFSVINDGEPRFDKKALADLIAFLLQITKTDLPNENAFAKTGAQRLHEFSQGKLAMIIAPAQAISWLREQPVNFKFGITNIPGTSIPGKYNLGMSCLYAGISDTCAYPDEAWLFLSFLLEKSPAIAARIKTVPGSLQFMLPAAKGSAEDYLNEDPLYLKAWDIYESSGIADTFSGYAMANELEQAVREELYNCFNGRTSPVEAAAAIQKRWEAITGNGE